MDNLAEAAAMLRDARVTRKPFPGFPPGLIPEGERGGYAIQDRLGEVLVRDLGPVVGYKVGCTSPALQAFMNIRNPCSGTMFAGTEVAAGGEIQLANYVRPGVECEVGVRLGSALDPNDGPIDRERAAQAVAACYTSIEIVDERYVDYRTIGTPTLIADNFMNAGFVRGAERTTADPLALDRMRASTVVNGKTVGQGVGSDILGHPLEVLVWLAREMASRGRPLAAGTLVTLGSVVVPYFPQRGDRVTMVNEPLGDLSVTVA